MKALSLCTGILLLITADAFAQTSAQGKPAPKRPKEFLIGGLFTGPSSAGSADAELLGGSGTPTVTLFRVEHGLIGYGLEANVAVQLHRALWVEVSGGWTRLSVNSTTRNDFEDGVNTEISSSMSRFVFEGALLRYFRERGASAWFIRGAGGWLRETAGGNTLAEDGLIARGGLGFRHWWRMTGKGSVKRTGLRIEGRADVKSGGISLGKKGIRFGPTATAHLVFGF